MKQLAIIQILKKRAIYEFETSFVVWSAKLEAVRAGSYISYDILFILQTYILYHQRDIFYRSQCTTSIEWRYIIFLKWQKSR